MTLLVLLAGFMIAHLSALALTPVFRAYATRQGWADHPGEVRKIHDRPVPQAGGVVIIAGAALGLLFCAVMQAELPAGMRLPSGTFLVGALAIGLAGFYDDLYGLGVKQKVLVQLIVAYAMVLAGHHIDISAMVLLRNLDPYRQALLEVPLTLVWIVGIINAVNLIDGLDGLAAGVSIIVLMALTVIFHVQGDVGMLVLAVVVIGAAGGFLVHNFNPASIFMGDTGSMFLGFVLAMYALQGTRYGDPHLALLVPLLALGFPVLDTGLSLVRRLARGASPFMPDRDHIHHRVIRMLRSHRLAVMVLYVISWAFGSLAILLAVSASYYRVTVMVLAGTGIYLLLAMLGYVRAGHSWRVLRRGFRRGKAQPSMLPQEATASGEAGAPRNRHERPVREARPTEPLV